MGKTTTKESEHEEEKTKWIESLVTRLSRFKAKCETTLLYFLSFLDVYTLVNWVAEPIFYRMKHENWVDVCVYFRWLLFFFRVFLTACKIASENAFSFFKHKINVSLMTDKISSSTYQ